MFDPKQLDDFARRIGEAMPAGLTELRTDIEKTARLGLQQVLEKMDLVTREEFEVQKTVLERTRARLEALEHRVAELEAAAHGADQ
ncbi:MAG TPA: accessory factor UbiK family protein [Chromatiales bacterium]|nr:accessory factor UbiK family protein [Chromatiales bacterium]